jgi:hypothetical protein
MPRGVSLYDEARLQGRLWHPSLMRPGVLAARFDPFEPYCTINTTQLATSISDLSGNGYPETAGATGTQASYSIGSINGLSVLTYNGTTQWMASNLPAAPAGDRTFIVVFKPAVATTHTLFGASSSGGLQFRIENNGRLSLLKEFVANIGTSIASVSTGSVYILAAYYNQSSGAYSFRINGSDAGGSGTNVQTLNASTTTFGKNPAFNGEYANGSMGEHAALNALSLDNLQRYEGYLASTYGVTLASGNPYSTGAPSGWTPNSLPAGTLAARYVPSDSSTATTTTTLAATIVDRSGNGNNETTLGTQPNISLNALNGYPVLGFTGSQALASTLSASPADRTFIALYRPAAVTTQTIFGASGSGGLQFRLEGNNALGLVKETVAGIGSSAATVPANAWALIVASYNQASGVYSFRLNGKAIGGGTNVQSLTATTTTVGKNNASGGEFANGLLAEHAALSSPTLREIIDYEAFLAWKYGLPQAVLDVSHVNRNRPPLIGD